MTGLSYEHSHYRGCDVMPVETLCRLSAHWYEGRLGAPYTRREPAAAAEYFRSVGLHGSSWGLPAARATRSASA